MQHRNRQKFVHFAHRNCNFESDHEILGESIAIILSNNYVMNTAIEVIHWWNRGLNVDKSDEEWQTQKEF